MKEVNVGDVELDGFLVAVAAVGIDKARTTIQQPITLLKRQRPILLHRIINQTRSKLTTHESRVAFFTLYRISILGCERSAVQRSIIFRSFVESFVVADDGPTRYLVCTDLSKLDDG